MSTWVRNGTGYPSAVDLDVTGTLELTNGTAPPDFDPDAVSSVQVQGTVQIQSGSFQSGGQEYHTVYHQFDLTLNAAGAVLASFNGADGILDDGTNGGSSTSVNETDSTIPTGYSNADWEGAELNPTGGTAQWTDYVKNKGADGVTVELISYTVTITYTPQAISYDETGRAVVITSTTAMTDVQDYVDVLATTITSTIAITDVYTGQSNVRGTASALVADSSINFNITSPTATVEGDVLVLFMLHGSGSRNVEAEWGQTGSDWTFVDNEGPANDESVALFYKAASATDAGGGGSYEFNTGNADSVRWVVAAVDSPASIYDAYIIIDDADVTDGITGNITPVASDTVLLAFVAQDAAQSTTDRWTSDDGMTEELSFGDEGNGLYSSLFSEVLSGTSQRTRAFSHGTTTGSCKEILVTVEASTAASTYDETGRATTITSTTALTDAQGYAELLRAVAITATINVSDAQGYAELLRAVTITATTNMTDVQNYVDLLMATAIVSTITVTDVLGAGGPTYDETGKAITITATVDMTDLVRIFETLLATTVASTTAMTDAQNYVDSLATVGTVTVSMTDLLSFYELLLATAGTTTVGMTDVQNYVEQLATTAASTLSISDVQNYVDALATAIVSFLTVRDIYTPVAGDPVVPSKSLQRRGRTSDQGIRTADRLARS